MTIYKCDIVKNWDGALCNMICSWFQLKVLSKLIRITLMKRKVNRKMQARLLQLLSLYVTRYLLRMWGILELLLLEAVQVWYISWEFGRFVWTFSPLVCINEILLYIHCPYLSLVGGWSCCSLVFLFLFCFWVGWFWGWGIPTVVSQLCSGEEYRHI